MLSKIWDGTHTCIDDIETVNCTFCQNIALWHQLAAQVMQHFSPRDPVKIPSKDIPKVEDLQGLNATSKEGTVPFTHFSYRGQKYFNIALVLQEE